MTRTYVISARYASKLDQVLDKLMSDIKTDAIPEAFQDSCKVGEVIELRLSRKVPDQAMAVLDKAIKDAAAKQGIKLVRSGRTFSQVKADRARKGIP